MGIPTDMRRTTTVAAFSCGSASGHGKRHSPYPATYRSHVADAAWGSYVAGSGLSRHEREAPARHVWSSSSRFLARGGKCHRITANPTEKGSVDCFVGREKKPRGQGCRNPLVGTL